VELLSNKLQQGGSYFYFVHLLNEVLPFASSALAQQQSSTNNSVLFTPLSLKLQEAQAIFVNFI